MKTSVLTFAFIFSLLHAYAQNLSFGPTGGLGHSWASQHGADRRFHTSYNIGGKMVYSFVTSWGISGDIKFSSEGQTVGSDGDNKSVARSNYIRVPLQGIYFFGKFGDRVRPKVSIGPSFGFLVGGKFRQFTNGNIVSEQKVSGSLKSFDFGVTVAAGGNVRIARATWLNLDLAYYHGLTNIIKQGANSKNRNLGINVGVTFPLATLRPDKLKR